MITTIEQARENYIAELRRYWEWVQKTKASYNGLEIMMWGNEDYRRAVSSSDGFKMVERVLGLSETEVSSIFAEVVKMLAEGSIAQSSEAEAHLAHVAETNRPTDPD
jgi:hypothetical protein